MHVTINRHINYCISCFCIFISIIKYNIILIINFYIIRVAKKFMASFIGSGHNRLWLLLPPKCTCIPKAFWAFKSRLQETLETLFTARTHCSKCEGILTIGLLQVEKSSNGCFCLLLLNNKNKPTAKKNSLRSGPRHLVLILLHSSENEERKHNGCSFFD